MIVSVMTLWRNWIAHWTSNPEVAGSNPVKVVTLVTIFFVITCIIYKHYQKLSHMYNRSLQRNKFFCRSRSLQVTLVRTGMIHTYARRRFHHYRWPASLMRLQLTWVRSSVVEHGIADPMVAGSIPVTPFCIQYLLVSLDGQDTRFSPWRPGFDSRMEKYFIAEAMAQLVARRIPDPKAGGSTPSSFTAA